MNSELFQQSLDSIINQINENKNYLSDEKFLKETIELIIQLNEKSFIDSMTINNHLFVILRDLYLNLFHRCQNGKKLNEISSSLLETISNFFLKMSNSLSIENSSILKEIIFHPTLCDEISRFLEEFSLGKKSFEDYQIQIIDHFFRTIQRLERISSVNEKTKFISHIVQCICSPIFFQIFLQSINDENNNPTQRFLLNTCIDYISSHYFDEQHQQNLIKIRQILLHPITQWINENSSTFRSWNHRFLIIFRQISFLLILPIQFNQNFILENNIYTDYCQLIDSFLHILYSIIIQPDHSILNKHFHQILIETLISNLSTMILSNQFEKYFQIKHINSLIIKLTSFPNDQIQFNVFKILSIITVEQHTKNVGYSNHLIKVFINFLKRIHDDQSQILRISDLFRFLKSKIENFLYCYSSGFLFGISDFIEYEQIQEEFLKENGLPLILHCATNNKFKSIQIQQIVLEILLALSFNKETRQIIKENIHQLKSSFILSHQGISNTFQDILWKLENNQLILDKDQIVERNFQYDVIVSFAFEDRQLAHQISEQLIKNDFRVWIDDAQGFSRTMNEKCQIIDSCEYFLLCVSDSYKHSSYSRCEATYAYEHHYPLIPLIVTTNYRTDGWLNRIIMGKFSINFSKLQFEVAFKQLKNEIDRQRKYLRRFSMKDFQSMNISIKNEYPCELDRWTNEDIQSFLNTKNLESLSPLFSQMNGNLLRQLYRMCLANRESMFHTLKNELSTFDSSNQSPLTLLTYLRFLSELEKYFPSFVIDLK